MSVVSTAPATCTSYDSIYLIYILRLQSLFPLGKTLADNVVSSCVSRIVILGAKVILYKLRPVAHWKVHLLLLSCLVSVNNPRDAPNGLVGLHS